MKNILLFGLLILTQSIESQAYKSVFNDNIRFIEFLNQAYSDTTNKQQKLLDLVRAQGQIKIWVYHNMEYMPENVLNTAEIFKQRSAIMERHTEFISELEFKNFFSKTSYKSIKRPVLSLIVDEEALKYIMKSQKVQKISLVERATVNLQESTNIINADIAWDLQFLGEGKIIVIIDTGVDSGHPMLEGKVIDGVCYSSNVGYDITSTCVGGSEFDFGSLSAEDCDSNIYGCDHGTHVAGIAAGNSSILKGVAPGANIISAKVFSSVDNPADCEDIDGDGIGDAPCAQAFVDDIIQALEYIYNVFYYQKSYNIAAINMSLGHGEFSSICDNTATGLLYQDAISDLYSSYIPIIAASGNNYNTDKLSAPACLSNVISVGATDKQDNHAPFSNAASFLDLVAPGVNITSAVPGGGTASFSGTSQAAPHVAGTIALMKEANQGSMPVSNVRHYLRNSAYWNDSPGSPWGAALPPTDKYGYGRLDAYQAIATTLKHSPFYYVTYDNQTINQTFEGETVYILNGGVAQVTDELVLDENSSGTPSKLYIHGTLNGSPTARIKLIGNSELITLPGGVINFSGIIEEINKLDSPTFATNTVLSQGTKIVGNTIIGNNVTLTISSATEVTIEGTVNGSNSNLQINGTLIMREGSSFTNIDIEVSSGGELVIQNGATLSFASGQGITAYGKVTIDNATLQKQGAPRWAGLSLQGSGADGSSITYSTIKGSVNGVQVVGADDTWLWQNVIEDHQHNGMYVSSANGTEIGWTTFRDNGGSGLVTDFSDVQFGIYNRFEDNTGDGLLADGSSFLHFGGVGDPGGAVFRGNRYGVYAKSLSWVHLGEDNYPYANTGGNNSIYWNLSKEVRVDMGSNVKAQLTWWGTSNPTAALFEDNPPFSVVDWSSWLSVAPVTKMAVDLPPTSSGGASEAPIISDADGHTAATV